MKKKVVFTVLVLLTAMSMMACGKGGHYKKATSLYESGSYEEAESIFAELDDYEDSAEMVLACQYARADELYQASDYQAAQELFEELDDYKDSTLRVQDCQYQNALALRESGDLEEALGIFEELFGYKDADAMANEIRHDIMLLNYGDVITLLQGETWFFNGGNDITLNCLTFSDTAATIQQITFNDKEGDHDNGTTENPYVVDADHVVLTLVSGEELIIPYTVNEGTVKLGSGDYFTKVEVQDRLQGLWVRKDAFSFMGIKGYKEDWIQFDGENVSWASIGNSCAGPYKGTYTLNNGSFDTDMYGGSLWYFNIIDGDVAVLHMSHPAERSDATAIPGIDE